MSSDIDCKYVTKDFITYDLQRGLAIKQTGNEWVIVLDFLYYEKVVGDLLKKSFLPGFNFLEGIKVYVNIQKKHDAAINRRFLESKIAIDGKHTSIIKKDFITYDLQRGLAIKQIGSKRVIVFDFLNYEWLVEDFLKKSKLFQPGFNVLEGIKLRVQEQKNSEISKRFSKSITCLEKSRKEV